MGNFFPFYHSLLKLRMDIQFCFASYWLHNWSILKNNTTFKILMTSALTWMYPFSLYANFYVRYEAVQFFCVLSNQYSCISDKNFEIPITPFDFYQIQLPGAVLNAELQGLFETVIGFKIWPNIDREMTV